MKTYTVTYEIEIDAKNKKEAAKEALDCILNSDARVFEVWVKGKDKKTQIDLGSSFHY